MLKKILIVITLSLLVLLGNYAVQSAAGQNRSGELNQKTTDAPTGTLQKMIVENGSVAMDLDLNRLNGINSPTQSLQQAHFAVGANSFFPILVFNDQLRGPVPGSMALIPQESVAGIGDAGVNAPGYSRLLGASLKQLAVEKLPSGQGADLAVRDSNTGFTFFNIQGHQYRLRPRCAVACYHQWQTARVKRARQRDGQAGRRGFSRWNNLRRRGNATNRGHAAC